MIQVSLYSTLEGVDVEEELGIGNVEGDLNGLLSSSYAPDNNSSWYEYGLYEKLKDQIDKLATYFITQQENGN